MVWQNKLWNDKHNHIDNQQILYYWGQIKHSKAKVVSKNFSSGLKFRN